MHHLRACLWTKSIGMEVALLIGIQVLPGCAVRSSVELRPPQSIGDWNSVLTLRPKDSVSVQLDSGPPIHGRFVSADAETLIIAAGRNGERPIPRQSVRLVEHRFGDRLFNGVLLGAGIGFLSGFLGEGLAYHAIGQYDGFPDYVSAGVGAVGAMIGAPIGLTADVLARKKRIVYRAVP